jgi:hypothetical protein
LPSSTPEPLSALLCVISPISPPLAALTRIRTVCTEEGQRTLGKISYGNRNRKATNFARYRSALRQPCLHWAVSSKFQKEIRQHSFCHPKFATPIRDSIFSTSCTQVSLREHARARSFVPDEMLSSFDSCSRGPYGCAVEILPGHPRQVPHQLLLARVRGGQGGG